MTDNQKRRIRDCMRLCGSLIFIWLYIPHLIIYFSFQSKRNLIKQDVQAVLGADDILKHLPMWICLLYHLHNNRYFRVIFYHRIGPALTLLFGWYRPGDRYFIISATTKIGGGLSATHSYATVLNADSIGNNFSCIHMTTIGKKHEQRPIIGNNVTVGANVTIIGGVRIGDNVTIGAGSVVVRDIPANCIAVGNPCKPIRFF